MKILTYMIAVAALVLLGACSHVERGVDLSGAADDSDGFFAVGTLAGVGSFEAKAAPLYTQIAVARHVAAVKLRHQEIPVAQAQSVQDSADVVRKLLDSALDACAQDQKTGKCTKNEGMADVLLDRAAVAISNVK